MLEEIRKALLKGRMLHQSLEMIYVDRQGRLTQRTIFVKKITEQHLIAFCTLRQQQRTFELTHILAVQKGRELENQQSNVRTKFVMGIY